MTRVDLPDDAILEEEPEHREHVAKNTDDDSEDGDINDPVVSSYVDMARTIGKFHNLFVWTMINRISSSNLFCPFSCH